MRRLRIVLLASFAIATPAAVSATASSVGPPAIIFSRAVPDSENRALAGVDATGTSETFLTHHGPTGVEPKWAAGGTKLVYSTGEDTLWLASPNGRNAHRIARLVYPSLSPNGDLVAGFVGSGDVAVVRPGGSRTALIRTHLGANDAIDGDTAPAWSPDERLLAYSVLTETDVTDYSRVYVVAADGTGRRLISLRRKAADQLPSWSPRGKLAMLSGRGDELVVLNADGTGRATVAHQVAAFSWSPAGDEIAYRGVKGGIYVARADGGRPRLIMASSADASRPVWGLGRRIAFADNGLLHVVDLRAHQSRSLQPVGVVTPSWWPGRRIVFDGASGEIFSIDPSGNHLARLTRRVFDSSPRWSPDGRAIAYVQAGGRDATSPAILVAGPDGRQPRRLALGSEPAWAPDSRRLAFTAPADDPNDARNGLISIVRVDRAGTRALARGASPAWSPDSRTLAYLRYNVSAPGGVVDGDTLRLVDADGKHERVLLSDAFYAGNDLGASDLYSRPVWSPDGTQIVVVAQLVDPDPTSGGTAAALVAAVNIRTGATRVVSKQGASDLAWSPDGHWIAGVTASGITLLAADGSSSRLLVSARRSIYYNDLAWSPDGIRLAYVACDERGSSEKCTISSVERDGSQNGRLTTGPGDGEPAWRPR
jgi:Tol biopolymer transport system component